MSLDKLGAGLVGAGLRLGLTAGIAGFFLSAAVAQAQQTQAPLRSPFGEAIPARSDNPAWFNFKLPGPESDPDTWVVQNSGLDLPAIPALFGPGPKDPNLGGAALKQDLLTIVGFSLQSRADGDYLWGRVTGRAGYERTTRWVFEQIQRAGVKEVRLEEFTAPVFALPVAGDVRLIGDEGIGVGSRDIILQSSMVGGSGPVDGEVTAPLIYVGQATDADLVGRDLKGKIAVINATPNPGLYSTNEYGRLQKVIKAGAVGAVEILQQAGNMKSFDRDRHGCGTSLCFTIGGEDGYFLQNILGAAAQAGQSVNARLYAKSETLTGAKMANVVAVLPGRTERTVIINAHADGWFTGADDNGSGLATFMGLVRHFAKGKPLDRTLVFVASAGHHTAANGLAAFRAVHDNDYVARADLILNLEHVANVGPARSLVEQQDNNFGRKLVASTTEWPKAVGVNNRAQFLVDIWRQGALCFGLSLHRVVDPFNPGELGRFAQLPIPQTQMISAGPLYHTSGETADAVPAEGLERAARFHAFLISEAAAAPSELLNGGAWSARKTCPPTP